MLRYLVGAVCMGFGGMLAGGCAVGAGLSGAAVFTATAWVTLSAMWGAAALTDWLVDQHADGTLDQTVPGIASGTIKPTASVESRAFFKASPCRSDPTNQAPPARPIGNRSTKNNPSGAVSWFQPHANPSLRLIEATGLPPTAAIIDIGGGASTLADDCAYICACT